MSRLSKIKAKAKNRANTDMSDSDTSEMDETVDNKKKDGASTAF